MKYLIYISIFIFFTSCKPDDTFIGFINAGAHDSNTEYAILNDTLPSSLGYNRVSYDVNYDGVSDFEFRITLTEGDTVFNYQTGVYIKSLHSDQVSVIDSIFGGTAKPYNNGEIINVTEKWSLTDLTKIAEYRRLQIPINVNDSVTLWRNLDGKYLGFRQVKKDKYFYGWFGIKVIGYNKIIIRDFAVNKEP
jgi:hypothetical protein